MLGNGFEQFSQGNRRHAKNGGATRQTLRGDDWAIHLSDIVDSEGHYDVCAAKHYHWCLARLHSLKTQRPLILAAWSVRQQQLWPPAALTQ